MDMEGGRSEYDVRESSTAGGMQGRRYSSVDCGRGSRYFEARDTPFWHVAKEMVLSSSGREEKISWAMYWDNVRRCILREEAAVPR